MYEVPNISPLQTQIHLSLSRPPQSSGMGHAVSREDHPSSEYAKLNDHTIDYSQCLPGSGGSQQGNTGGNTGGNAGGNAGGSPKPPASSQPATQPSSAGAPAASLPAATGGSSGGASGGAVNTGACGATTGSKSGLASTTVSSRSLPFCSIYPFPPLPLPHSSFLSSSRKNNGPQD